VHAPWRGQVALRRHQLVLRVRGQLVRDDVRDAAEPAAEPESATAVRDATTGAAESAAESTARSGVAQRAFTSRRLGVHCEEQLRRVRVHVRHTVWLRHRRTHHIGF